jgi:DDE superfamily endonuclease
MPTTRNSVNNTRTAVDEFVCDSPGVRDPDIGDLTCYCRRALQSLPRSDQRRWGEIYVRGLVTVPGRKSIRRIAEQVVGQRVDQGLQQFVNQSPWCSATVRSDVAHGLTAAFRPRAWVVDELVFPKNGANSCGVARQFAARAGRVLNCQLGIGVFLAGEGFAGAVNWRLMLPPHWDADHTLRARAHLPPDELARPRWDYVLDCVDEMTAEWGLTPAPVVVDARHDTAVDLGLLRGLEDRGLHYLVRLSAGTPLQVGPATTGAVTAGAVVAGLRRGTTGLTLSRRDADGPLGATSRFVVEPLPSAQLGACGRRPARLLLVEWSGRDQQRSSAWLTNLTGLRLPELIALTRVRQRMAPDVSSLYDDLGLGHFEGRSFRGWHHHVTLVSLAQAYTLLRRLYAGGDPGLSACANGS